MSDLPSAEIEVSQVPEQPDAPGGVADALETVVTGVPAPIRKNLSRQSRNQTSNTIIGEPTAR